jgi:hypothetical protein
MGNERNSGMLPLAGIILLIFGLMIGLITGISQITGSKNSAGNIESILPLLSSVFIWYGIAIVLVFFGILLIFLGRE